MEICRVLELQVKLETVKVGQMKQAFVPTIIKKNKNYYQLKDLGLPGVPLAHVQQRVALEFNPKQEDTPAIDHV